jgi:hypothetical protein
MKLRVCLVILLVSLLASTAVWADYTVTYNCTNPIPDTTTNYGGSGFGSPNDTVFLDMPQWNQSAFVGYHLTGLSISFNADVYGSMKFENTDPGTGSTIYSDTGIGSIQDLYDPSNNLLLTQLPSATIGSNKTLSPWDGTTDYAGTDSATFDPLTNTPASVVWSNGTSYYLTMFTGNGTVNMPTDAYGSVTQDVSGGNINSSYVDQAGASATITYDYALDTPSVPEPGTWALGALCLLGLCMYEWRRRK